MDEDIVNATWEFLDPLAKKWKSELRNGKIPKNKTYVKVLKQHNADAEGIAAFLQPYDDDKTPFEVKAVLHWCQNAELEDLLEDDEPSIWLDDRNYGAYFGHPIPGSPTRINNVSSSTSSVDITDIRSSGAMPLRVGQGPKPRVSRTLTATLASQRYSPTSTPRRYLKPMNAHKLYSYLKQKVSTNSLLEARLVVL